MSTLALPRALAQVRFSTFGILSVIMLAGCILRLAWLDAAPLWYDETGSRWMATLPWDKMIAATAGDAHPPLYLALLWGWVRLFGDTEAALRLPSVIASVLCVPYTFAIARSLRLSKPVSLVASALVAVLPAQLWYAQEARMYALLTLEVAIALYAALNRNWFVFGLALAAGYWTHNYGLFYAVPLNIVAAWVVFVRARPAPARQGSPRPMLESQGEETSPVQEQISFWLFANVIALASWLPWLTVLVGQMADVSAGYWIQNLTAGQLLYALYMALFAFAPSEPLQVHVALFVFLILAFSGWRAIAHRATGPLLMLAFSGITLAVSVIVSLLWQPVVLFRGFVPLGVPLCILIGWAVTDKLSVSRRAALGALAAPLVLAALVSGFQRGPTVKGDSSILKHIDFKSGDILYHANDGSLMLAHTYAPTLPQFELPATWHTPGALSVRTKQALGVQMIALDELQWQRAWLIVGSTPMTTAQEDEAVRLLLLRYISERIYFKSDTLTTQAVYLLLNKKIVGGVP